MATDALFLYGEIELETKEHALPKHCVKLTENGHVRVLPLAKISRVLVPYIRETLPCHFCRKSGHHRISFLTDCLNQHALILSQHLTRRMPYYMQTGISAWIWTHVNRGLSTNKCDRVLAPYIQRKGWCFSWSYNHFPLGLTLFHCDRANDRVDSGVLFDVNNYL